MHAGGRRFDPVWLHQFRRKAVAANEFSGTGSGRFLVCSLTIWKFLMSCLGQFLIDSIQVSHLHMSRDTVRPGAGQGCRNAASTKGRSEFAHRL